jgi:hypothetical protein
MEVLCVYFLFVETKGPSLEEIAILFDGSSAAVANKAEIDAELQDKSKSGDVTSHVEWAKN